jgi:sodium-dependent dicarboxylate transporter 2/3/5
MGTIIGTPPNAIAVGALGDNAPSFLEWMVYAVPPALMIILIVRFLLLKIYPSSEKNIDENFMKGISSSDDVTDGKKIPFWHKIVVIIIFSITILLWLTSSLHNLPTTVVAFLPIVIFTITGIVDSEDIRSLPWDVLLLITGGLSLGLAVSNTGLASWLANSIPLVNFDILVVIILFSFIVVTISNFMSNTAATNILLPIVIAIVTGFNVDNELLTNAIIIVALSASNAMLLSVSTPPNAIVYSSGMIRSKDFLMLGLLIGIIGPVLVISWIWVVMS